MINYKKFFKIVGSTVLYFCIIGAILLAGLYYFYPDIFNNFSFAKIINPASFEKPVNVLFMGLDEVSGNTDVIVLANINLKSKKVNVISIPRDTKVQHKGKSCKINSMYARGKEALAKEKVGELIGKNIDYALIANPKGFRNIIDIFGGVEVNVPRDMDYDDYDQNLHIHLKKGIQVLNGKKSEEFVRYRHDYAGGDLGRIDAQHIFFKAFVEQKIKPKYIFKADKIIGEIFANVKTDMPISQAIKYSMYAKDLKTENVKFFMLPGESRKMSKVWYFIYDPVGTQKLVAENFNDLPAEDRK